MSDNTERSLWGSRIGFLFAAIGSAVGLGNIWRFSNMAYQNGGGAFLIPYFVALLIAGLPIMVAEYALGHKYQGASPLAFAKAHKKAEWAGWWMPTMASMGIMFFYAVVIGWCINYCVYSFDLAWGQDTGKFFFNKFLLLKDGGDNPYTLSAINYKILFTTAIVWFLCWIICFKEVNHGIEKACLVFMPLLLLLTIILVAWTVTLDGAGEGIKAYLTPHWEKINVLANGWNPADNKAAWKVWTSAFGQIFFTLSIGFGIMITYASYLPKKTNLVGNALFVCIANCAYSIFAGFAVFGVLGFMAKAQNVDISAVAKAGPSLCFVVYPQAINQLPFAQSTFGVLFFLALIVAGLSSGISLIEAFACSITDKFNVKRVHVITFICIAGFLGSIIFTTNIGLFVLDTVDHFINNYGLLTGGLLECLLVGWVIKAKVLRHHANNSGGIVRLPVLWDVCIMLITPLILISIIVMSFISDISEPYGKYPLWMIWGFGVGSLEITLLISIVVSWAKWPKKHTIHKPEDEHLLT